MDSLSPKLKREQSITLDSGEGPSYSLLFDVESGRKEDDDAEVVSKALTDISIKSPKAICTFIGCLTPIVVVCAIDWDDLQSNKLSKMTGGQCRWFEPEIRCFLEYCLEEIVARNITRSCPKTQGYVNPVKEDAETPREALQQGSNQVHLEPMPKKDQALLKSPNFSLHPCFTKHLLRASMNFTSMFLIPS
uniref:Uncharacterized protein n=1 Tax=Leersia perrieri TaxID=77586 RepID=A0A0D9W346_9ORYZ